VKVVLDANVLFAAFVTRGTCAEVLDTTIANHALVASKAILGEVRRNLAAKVGARGEDLDRFETVLRAMAIEAEPAALDRPVSRDPDDDAVLGPASAAGADLLVTGDEDLPALRSFRNAPIVSPREFLQAQARRGSS
jgi:putative PIN family toxin of toxin-antitoxin system